MEEETEHNGFVLMNLSNPYFLTIFFRVVHQFKISNRATSSIDILHVGYVATSFE